MASRYTNAPKEVTALAQSVMKKFHPDLDTHDVKIDILMAFAAENDAGEKVSCALRIHGYQANALTKIVNLPNRVKGCGDAEIMLDGDIWDDLSEARQRAVLDHQLHFLVVRKNHEGSVIEDTHGRPKLSMRQYDRTAGWFDAVAKRNGVDSIEVEQAKHLFEVAGQIYFGFLNPELKGLDAPDEGAE